MTISIDLHRDRFIRTTQIENRVVFSLMHVRRLEMDGLFPRRFQIAGRAVGWSLREVMQWMQERLDDRPGASSLTRTLVQPNDRLISAREVCSIASISKHKIDHLESRGAFPRRAQIGAQRVAWLEREVRRWTDEVRRRSDIDFDD